MNLQANDAPDVGRSSQGEHEAGEQNGRTSPLELTVFPVVEVAHGQLAEESDGEDHVQRREYHVVHHGLDLLGRSSPCLLYRACHITGIATGGKGRNTAVE